MRDALLGCVLMALVSLPAAAAKADLTGTWEMRAELPSAQREYRLTIAPKDEQFTANWGPLGYEGKQSGDSLEFRCVTDWPDLPCGHMTLRLKGATLEGEGVILGAKAKLTGKRPIPRREGAPKTFTYEPDRFSPHFSGSVPPVLRIFPGDTVKTSTVDAYGRDGKGEFRSFLGNPQTGPFYVEGAMPGDTVAVRFNRIRTNGPTAQMYADALNPNVLAPWTLRGFKTEPHVSGVWNLDADKGIATPADPPPRLRNFTLPLAPMLGCVGVAPAFGEAIGASDAGSFGGNMDYRRITEGVTIYLPVYQRGALLFMGDGHAAQGDGELSGQGLETSMDVEFTVGLIENQSLETPWAENDQEVMVMGIQGSLTLAMQAATSSMSRWLIERYKLNNAEVTMVISSSMRYDIAEVVGGRMNVVARLDKSVLAQIAKP